jgi:hypothetical protein
MIVGSSFLVSFLTLYCQKGRTVVLSHPFTPPVGFLLNQRRTNGSILGGSERTLWEEEKGSVKTCVDYLAQPYPHTLRTITAVGVLYIVVVGVSTV